MTRLALLLSLALPLSAQQAEPTPSVPAPAAAPTATPVPTPAASPVSTVTPAPAVKPLPAPAVDKVLDDGLLHTQWFGPSVSFVKGDDVDFFWMKPGLSFAGHTVHMLAWDDPSLPKTRDGKDQAKASELTDALPGMLRGALAGIFGDKAKVSRNEGDWTLVGRIVDCNAGSRAAKFLVGWGAGSEMVTYDFKVVDVQSGEVVMAVHHRVISGTALSTINDKFVKWCDKFATFLKQKTVI